MGWCTVHIKQCGIKDIALGTSKENMIDDKRPSIEAENDLKENKM